MSHTIQIKSEARKYLLRLDSTLRRRISRNIDILADNPRPFSCKKLKGLDAYRIRIGDYRVIYEVHDDVLVVLVVRVAHRREAYKA
jgi:mRNA interferase RelE/StbE